MKTIRIGTRPSKLALAQTAMFIEALRPLLPEVHIETVIIKTSGDCKQNSSGELARDKRDWIQELEQAILNSEIDLAVHSGKDVPYDISIETKILSVLDRADPRDIFIGKLKHPNSDNKNSDRIKFKELQQGATIGTSSLRRRAQLLRLRPDLNVLELRGNVPTRINKLDSDLGYDGIILAAAGITRLGLSLQQMELMPEDEMLPASAQGILTVQLKNSRQDLASLLEQIQSSHTETFLKAERAVVRCLAADCSSAVAVHAFMLKKELKVLARVFSCSSQEMIEASVQGAASNAEQLGKETGESLLGQGAGRLLAGS